MTYYVTLLNKLRTIKRTRKNQYNKVIMAKQRMINTKFWIDSYISALDPIEKLLFLYFLTNPYTDICGIYEVPLKHMALETGVEESEIIKILKKLEKDDKVFYENGWIAIKNFAKHQLQNPKVDKGIQSGFSRAPETLLDKLSIDYNRLSYINININSNINNNLNNKSIAKSDVSNSLKEKRKNLFTDSTPMGLIEGVKWLQSDTKKHIRIIGDYAETAKPDLRTKGQWYEFINRNVKAASRLVSYEKDQLENAFERMEKDMKNDKNPKGFLTKWTLETLIKYL